MRRLAVLLAPILWLSTARAAEVSFPLTVDYALLGRALRETLTADQTGDIVLWGTATGCRSLVLRDVAIDAAQERARIVARGRARVGFGFLRFCFAPLSWDGYLDSLATPEVGRDWQLRFRDLDSHLYDGQHRRTVVASRLWEVAKSRVEERFEAFHFDLAPPIDEASALIRASVAPERAEPVVAALRTLRPRAVTAQESGVRVEIAIDVPPEPPAVPTPEAPLGPEELQRWQAALESWDAFLVFVIKDLGIAGHDREVRSELFDLLLSSRHELLVALAGEPQPGVDPVRQLFLRYWDRLHDVVRRAALSGTLEGRPLRYATFLAAGDALAAVDAAERLVVARPARCPCRRAPRVGRAGGTRPSPRPLGPRRSRALRIPGHARSTPRPRRGRSTGAERARRSRRPHLPASGEDRRLAGELLAALRTPERQGDVPAVKDRRHRAHAGEPPRLARILRPAEARVGRRLQRRRWRGDPGAAAHALRPEGGGPPARQCRARHVLGLQRRPWRVPPLPPGTSPACAAGHRPRLLRKISGDVGGPGARLRAVRRALGSLGGHLVSRRVN